MSKPDSLSRRQFIAGFGGIAAVAGLGLVGCGGSSAPDAAADGAAAGTTAANGTTTDGTTSDGSASADGTSSDASAGTDSGSDTGASSTSTSSGDASASVGNSFTSFMDAYGTPIEYEPAYDANGNEVGGVYSYNDFSVTTDFTSGSEVVAAVDYY